MPFWCVNGAGIDRNEISGQWLGGGELMLLHAARKLGDRGLGCVADDDKSGMRGHRHRERRLEAGFVEAGIGGARVNAFELCPAVPGVADLDVEQTRRAVTECAGVVERERGGAGGHGAGEIEPGGAGRVDLREGGDDNLATDHRYRLRHVQIATMEVYGLRHRLDRDVDFVVAGKGVRLGQDGEVQPVRPGYCRVGQSAFWSAGVRCNFGNGGSAGGGFSLSGRATGQKQTGREC